MLKFLLLVATRGSKVKRKGGTESGITEESPKALVMITAIEPFVKSELINRTLEINFSKHFHNEGFIDDEVTRQILKKRDLIISGLLKLIQREILPNLEKRTAYITTLNVTHKGHSKERMNAFLALMMLILERLLRYWDIRHHDPADIWNSWIVTQDHLAREHEVSSNDILKLFDGLIREYRLKMDNEELRAHYVYGYKEEVYQYTHPEYGISIIRTKPQRLDEDPEYTEEFIEFEATSKDLTHAFARFCKNNGLTNPYPSASVFGSRLGNDRKILGKGNWNLISKDPESIYFKTVRGQRFLKFRHRLIR
jgi:DNA primase